MASTPIKLQDLNDDGGDGDSGGIDTPAAASTGVDADAGVAATDSGEGQGTDAADDGEATKQDLAKAAPPTKYPVVNEASVPEKLADDVMLPPLWRRLLYRVFPSLERSECPVSWSISAVMGVVVLL